MIASVTSYGSLTLAQGAMTHAVTPTAESPDVQDQPQPASAAHVASAVALAPAAMTALIEAQAQLAPDTPVLTRAASAQKIDHLLSRLDADQSPPAGGNASLDVRQLQTARQALSQPLLNIYA